MCGAPLHSRDRLLAARVHGHDLVEPGDLEHAQDRRLGRGDASVPSRTRRRLTAPISAPSAVESMKVAWVRSTMTWVCPASIAPQTMRLSSGAA